jgi:transcriptional regulator with XRE-family HTH domain
MLEEARFHIELGQRIRSRRETLRLTQDQVADGLALSRTSIVNIEKGRQRLLVFQLVRLAAALRCDPIHLLPTAKEVSSEDLRQMLHGHRPSVVEWVAGEVSEAIGESE